MKPGFETVSKQQAAHVAIFVTRLMQSLARVRQNRASEAKRGVILTPNLTRFHSWKRVLFTPSLELKSLRNGLTFTPYMDCFYILLNEIQTMFSQLAKPSARLLLADLCTDHAHYVKNHRSMVLRKNKNMADQGGTVFHYHILVIRKFIDFMSLFRHNVWFSFSVKQFPFAEFGICNK